ncbi:MAG: helix-turn-helix domain-containing protein [Actinocatenispora sp.]
MPRPRSDSREKIIRGAQTLLCRHGYQGTGLARIVEESGTPRGSTYFLFPGGKEQIAVEAVAASGAEFEAVIRAARGSSTSAGQWIRTMAGGFAESLTASGFTEGCPVSTVTLDSAPTSPQLTDACRTVYDRWLAALAAGLADFGVPADRADDLATVMLASLEGAMMLCRAYRSTDPLRVLERQVVQLVEAAVPPT